MSSSKFMPEADRLKAVNMDSTQPPETFLRHVLESHFDRLYDLPENMCNKLGGGRRQLYSDATGVGLSGSHKEQQTHSGDGI